MLQVLQPVWMMAAAGIVVPVVIHLWKRKPGKTVKVGSIALLQQRLNRQAKSLKLHDLFLLLLRCVLILLIAILLSAPVWQARLNPEKERGWILMEKQGLQQTYAHFKPLVDSLLKQGFEFHYFDTGFEKADFKTAPNTKADTLFQNPIPYWSLLAALDQNVPANVPVHLFTTNRLQRFAGARPAVAMNLNWRTYAPEDSVAGWLAKAYGTAADSVRFITAKSGPSGTAYGYATTGRWPQKTPDYNLYTNGKNLLASFRRGAPVIIDTATFSITIFTDKFPTDAAYLKAAIEAIQQVSERRVKLSVVNDPDAIPPHQDWVFWLSDAPVAPGIGKNVFSYAKGKAEAGNSWIKAAGNRGIPEAVLLYKRIPYPPTSSSFLQPVWLDGFSKPVLELETGASLRYHFFSRFDPSWNDLTWSPFFPQVLFNLMFREQDSVFAADRRVIAEQQVQPGVASKEEAIGKKDLLTTYGLLKIFWVAAFIVFFAERAVSFKTKKQKIHA